MGKSWFTRILLSYLPVFMITITLLLFFFFLGISEIFKKEAQEANEVYSSQVMKQIDLTLNAIDQSIIKEMMSNKDLRDFFNPLHEENPYFNAHKVSESLDNMVINNPMINSIYIYRNSDQMVLSKNRIISINEFGDQEFLKGILQSDKPRTWSGKRQYREFKSQTDAVPVITLVRNVIFFSGEDGLIVTNIRIAAIQNMLLELFNSGTSYEVIDADGKVILRSGDDVSNAEANKTVSSKFISEVVSPYTHWHLQSGLTANQAYQFISQLSSLWVVVGLLTIVFGIGWLVYITKQNYRPIENMADQIQLLIKKMSRKLSIQTEGNELQYIERAIESLIEESHNYQQLNKENMSHRKKLFFQELMEGQRVVTMEEWIRETEQLNLSQTFLGGQVAIFELDKYKEFSNQYTSRDQYLLKYAVYSVIKEVAQNHALTVWVEWMDHHLIGVLYQYGDRMEMESNPIQPILEEVRGWVQTNLTFTVTVGVGSLVHDVVEICRSYEEANESLKYRYMLGSNRTIVIEDIRPIPKGEVYSFLQQIRLLAQQFRLGNLQWQEDFKALFKDLQNTLLSGEDIENIFSYFIYQYNHEISELSAEYQKVWQENGLQQLNDAAKQLDTMEEFQKQVYETLSRVSAKMNELRETRHNRLLLVEVRDYIEQNYFDPNLSLNQLNDKFQISAKYLSHLFKEEFGENFVEYLAYVRVMHAKQLLTETLIPVQDIAKHVGYQHHVSFNRVFKKITGKTPVLYRSESKEAQ